MRYKGSGSGDESNSGTERERLRVLSGGIIGILKIRVPEGVG